MAFEDINEVGDRDLHILWTNADPATAENMVFMYAENSMLNKWWDKVTIICWGSPQTLIVSSKEVQDKIHYLQSLGVHVSACLTCAKKIGVEEQLLDQGLEVVRWGKRLTDLMQNHKHVLSI